MFTDPVTGIDFFDRSYFLNILIKRAKALEEGYRQNVALLGPEAIGKTSLILQFLSQLQEQSKSILPIYLEITTDIPFENLAKKFIAVIIFNLLKKQKYTPPDSLDAILENAQTLIPKTIAEVKRCLTFIKNNKFNDAYATLLSLPQILASETGMPVIVIFEEFHRLDRLPLNKPFATLAKKIMVGKNVMHIISSSSVSQARRILAHDLTLLFGNFEILTLEPFDLKTSDAFIENKLKPIKCSSYYKQFIIEITNGQPLYLNTVCSEINSIIMKNRLSLVTDQVIIEALSKVLFDSEGFLNQIFTYRINQLPTNRSPISYTSILLALGHNYLKLKQIKDYLNTASEKEFLNHLSSLVEFDYVQKNGVFHYLNDELFKIWLIDVFENKRSSLEVENDIKAERFKKSLQRKFDIFLRNKQKNTTERLKDLFVSFNNEITYLNSKRISLPNFQNIEVKNAQTSPSIIIGKARNKLWLFVVRKERVCEETMGEIISNCRKLSDRYTRKFVIALGGIDENAQLMAKEEKFLTLELHHLNNILKLFGKNNIFSD